MYVIHKATRAPDKSGSYCGATWDSAGIRHKYKQFYTNKNRAKRIAAELTKFNPVGFEVSVI
jgi:hypothetical protein